METIAYLANDNMAEATGVQLGDYPAAGADHHHHEAEAPASPPPKAGLKKYYMEYTTSRSNARLRLGSMTGPVEYYLQTKITLKAPQILLRRGDHKKAPVVAFCKLQNLSRHGLLGRGDCEQQAPEQLVWEELHRDKNVLRRSDYQFGTAEGSPSGARAEFSWRKDRGKINRTVFDCVDERGNTVARMLSGGAFNFNRAGDIDVAEGLSQGLEEYLVVSAAAIWAYEALAYQSLLQGFEKEEKDRGKKKD